MNAYYAFSPRGFSNEVDIYAGSDKPAIEAMLDAMVNSTRNKVGSWWRTTRIVAVAASRERRDCHNCTTGFACSACGSVLAGVDVRDYWKLDPADRITAALADCAKATTAAIAAFGMVA